MCIILVKRLEDCLPSKSVVTGKLTMLDITPLGWLGPVKLQHKQKLDSRQWCQLSRWYIKYQSTVEILSLTWLLRYLSVFYLSFLTWQHLGFNIWPLFSVGQLKENFCLSVWSPQCADTEFIDQWSVRLAEWFCAPDQMTKSQFRIPLEVEFSSWMYGASLHRAFHYYPFFISIWLK